MRPTKINGTPMQEYENRHEVQETPPSIVMCRRADKHDAKSDSQTAVCTTCGCGVWISPTSAEAARIAPSLRVLCDDCGMVAMAMLAALDKRVGLATVKKALQ